MKANSVVRGIVDYGTRSSLESLGNQVNLYGPLRVQSEVSVLPHTDDGAVGPMKPKYVEILNGYAWGFGKAGAEIDKAILEDIAAAIAQLFEEPDDG